MIAPAMHTGSSQQFDREMLLKLVLKDKKSKKMSSSKLAHEYHKYGV